MGEGKQNTAPVSHEDAVDFHRLMFLLWSRNWIIATITLGAAIIAIIFALLIPDAYRAEVSVAPDDPDIAGGLSALASQYGGLASLAGIDLTDQSVDRTALALEILKSRKFLTEVLDDHEIPVDLMVVDGWNPDTGVSKIDPGTYDVDAGEWVREEVPARAGLDRNSFGNVRPLLFSDGRVGLLQLWTSVTQILYQSAIVLAAVDSFGN